MPQLDRLAGMGVGTADELCRLEQLPEASQMPGEPPPPIDQYPPRNMVRNALKDGCCSRTCSASIHSDTASSATPTAQRHRRQTPTTWYGASGQQRRHAGAPDRRQHAQNNPAALTVRVGGGELARRDLRRAAPARRPMRPAARARWSRFLAARWRAWTAARPISLPRLSHGKPMGGDLGPVRGAASPALCRAGGQGSGHRQRPGTPLQRCRSLKGWVDASGQTQEQVFDVAGDPDNGASVDPSTWTRSGSGADQLVQPCWEDPALRPARSAHFTTCGARDPPAGGARASARRRGSIRSRPTAPRRRRTSARPLPTVLQPEDDAFFSPVIQERAWTSPIWYRPDGIADVRRRRAVRPRPGTDRLALTIRIGRDAARRRSPAH